METEKITLICEHCGKDFTIETFVGVNIKAPVKCPHCNRLNVELNHKHESFFDLMKKKQEKK